MFEEIKKSIIDYWTGRAESYSALNRDELTWDTKAGWLRAMECTFPEGAREDLKILDIGTGPGFISILLAKAGYSPDAVDCTAEMLKEAKKNAGEYAGQIRFHLMNADDLDFEDASFDVIVNRNLTWNLPNPCVCYEEWLRVLKPGGKVVIFDANWYRYLFDSEAKTEYDRDREEVARKALTDFNIGPNFDVMEEIARGLPMSKKARPFWDRDKMTEVGYASVDICEDIWKDVWTAEEKTNYASTPMFRITAAKHRQNHESDRSNTYCKKSHA